MFWTRTQVSFSRCVIACCSCPKVLELEGFHVVVAALTVSSAASATLVLWSPGLHVASSDVRFFAGLRYNRRIVPQDTPESCPGTIPPGEVAFTFLYLLSSGKDGALCWQCFVNSGCSCPTRSSAPSWCCHSQRTSTTERRASATGTSLKLVTCAQCAYQVSLSSTSN